jgi:hypothetical protein
LVVEAEGLRRAKVMEILPPLPSRPTFVLIPRHFSHL